MRSITHAPLPHTYTDLQISYSGSTTESKVGELRRHLCLPATTQASNAVNRNMVHVTESKLLLSNSCMALHLRLLVQFLGQTHTQQTEQIFSFLHRLEKMVPYKLHGELIRAGDMKWLELGRASFIGPVLRHQSTVQFLSPSDPVKLVNPCEYGT